MYTFPISEGMLGECPTGKGDKLARKVILRRGDKKLENGQENPPLNRLH